MKKILIVCLLFFLIGCGKTTSSSLSLTFITLEKGDAFIISVNDEKHYMIDTGKEKDFKKIDSILKDKNIKELDGIIITHGHKDHAGSLKQILENYKVNRIYVSSQDDVSYKKINVIDIAGDYGVELIKVNKGDQINVNDVNFKFWIPDCKDLDNENNNSIITTITHGENKLLMMGDAEKDEELLFLDDIKNVKASVLKLGHHGEDDATSKKFLFSVSPLIAIKTANIDENPDSYNNDVDKLLTALNVEVYNASGEAQAYEFISDGKYINVKEFK